MAHLEQEEIRAVSEDLTRAERAQLALADRIRGGTRIADRRAPRGSRRGCMEQSRTAARTGCFWKALVSGVRWFRFMRSALCKASASCSTACAEHSPPPASLTGRLRALARDRRAVLAETAAGRMTGRISAVGADWVEMRILPTGEAAAGGAAGSVVTIPVRSLLQIVDG